MRPSGMYRNSTRLADPSLALLLIAAFAGLALATRLLCRDAVGNSAFWAANAALVVAFLILPMRWGLIVAVACWSIYVGINLLTAYTLKETIVFSTLNVAMSLTAALLVRRFCGAALDLSRFSRMSAFAVICFVASALEATVGEIFVPSTAQQIVGDWVQWALCDGLGLLLATPGLLMAVNGSERFGCEAGRLERWILFAATLGVALLAFSTSGSPMLFAIYPMLVLTTFRAGPPWVMVSVLLVALVASAETVHGHGPLAVLSPGGSLLRQDMVQPFLISLFACAVPANSALGERSRSARRLQRSRSAAQAARSAAVSANLAKSQFIANFSHEIRTPLNGVLGMAQALKATDLSPTQRERLEVIQSSGEMLLGILNGVLDFAKIDAGKLELESIPVDVARLVRGVAATFSALAEQKALVLDVIVASEAEGGFLGDPTRLRQVVANLLSNAIKFTASGEVRVSVGVDGDRLVIAVRDSGEGIAPEKLARLFLQFGQVDASTTRRFGGTGLGLSICRELARLMGGDVEVDSRLGEGSEFRVGIILPRAALACDPPLAADTQAPTSRGDMPALRVLAADDNAVNRYVLNTLLNGLGLYPDMVENGAEAVQAWRDNAYDVILMDMQMPVLDGLAATRSIRRSERETGRRRTPIVAFTADVMKQHLESYWAAGADRFVAKPVEVVKLVEAIEACLVAPEQSQVGEVA